MTVQTLGLDSLLGVSEDEVIRKLREFNDLPVNGEIEEARKSIRDFERRYEITTSEMLEQVKSGRMRSTPEQSVASCDGCVNQAE